MKTILLLIFAGIASASPITVMTVITDQQYRTAILGAADADFFVQAFLGYPPPDYVCCFTATVQYPFWTLSAVVDPTGDSGPGLPPIVPPITPPPSDPPQEPPPIASVPEPGTFGLLLIGGVMFRLVRR